jgi:hypothetical protein
MKKTTVIMAAVLAVATVLAAGLTVLPSGVQEAQANPCALEADDGATVTQDNDDDERECKFIGNFEDAFEDESSDSGLAATETDGAEATETDGAEATTGNNIIDDPLFDLADAFDESD